MENYICINGKKAELTEEQMKALGIELPKDSPFDRAEMRKIYYYISPVGDVTSAHETEASFDKYCFDVANYCTDKEIMKQRVLHENLSRLLWRYSMEHKSNEIHKSATNRTVKYGIGYWEPDDTWRIDGSGFHPTACARGYSLEPYFESEEIAQNAIKEIVEPFMAEHPDFVW